MTTRTIGLGLWHFVVPDFQGIHTLYNLRAECLWRVVDRRWLTVLYTGLDRRDCERWVFEVFRMNGIAEHWLWEHLTVLPPEARLTWEELKRIPGCVIDDLEDTNQPSAPYRIRTANEWDMLEI